MDDVCPGPRSRWGLCCWFVAQWVVIPVVFIGLLLWNIAVLLGDGYDAVPMTAPPAWFVSPRRFVLEWSRSEQRWERHVTAELSRLAGELAAQRFSLRSRIRFAPKHLPVDDDRHYANGFRLPPREYRCLAPSAVVRIAGQYGLVPPRAARHPQEGVALVTRAHRPAGEEASAM